VILERRLNEPTYRLLDGREWDAGMSGLENDSLIMESPDGMRSGTIGSQWDGFGPNGGFLATMSIRAAMPARGGLPRTIQTQFIRSAAHGTITFSAAQLAQTTRSEVTLVTANQGERVILTTLLQSGSHIERNVAKPPDVTDPDLLKPIEELLPPESFLPMTGNFEERPVTWERAWPPPAGRPPTYITWCRFRPNAVFADPYASVGRYLVLLDTYVWAAVQRGAAGANGLFARSTDLSVTVEDVGTADDWLLCHVTVPVMRDGNISASGTIWSRDGQQLASGAMNMVCAPARGGTMSASPS